MCKWREYLKKKRLKRTNSFLMAPKIPQKGDPNPNPQELTSEVKKECDDENRIRLRAANIKIFKAVVMKIAGSAPNKRSLKRFINQLCSHQRTPDHPPYATVIGSSIFSFFFLSKSHI